MGKIKRTRRKAVRLSLDVNDEKQMLLHEYLLRFQPQYRGLVVAEMFSNLNSSTGPITYLENRLLTNLENLLSNFNKHTNTSGNFNASINIPPVATGDIDTMLDNEIDNILGGDD